MNRVPEHMSRLWITPATLDDLPALEGLLGRCIAAMRAAGIDQWDEIYPSRDIIERDVQSGTTYVLRMDAEIVAMYVLNDQQDPAYGDVPWAYPASSVCVVHRLMVHPEHSGHGYARRLMHDAEDRARTAGADVMRLDAFDANPRACALYVGLGYRHAGQVRFRKGLVRCYEKRLSAE